MISYIVAMDNSVAMMSNFFGFIQPELNPDDEVIIVSDGCDLFSTHKYIQSIVKDDSRFKLVESNSKVGFAKANNLGVAASKYDTLVFINTDIFPTEGCIGKMIDMLYSSDKIAAVQPLLVYPQTGVIQSTGHVFSKTKSGQLFANRRIDTAIVKKSAPRQALTMALCAMKRDVFYEMGGFNEDYYNSHEGMELTLKLTLNGYLCMYCADAMAYHCSGVARSQTAFDISRQRAYFYQQWGNTISSDLEYFLREQLDLYMDNSSYIVYNFSSSTDWNRILDHLNINRITVLDSESRFERNVNLYNCISFTHLHNPTPYLFLCDDFTQLNKNQNWIKNRNNSKDIVLDLNGNLLRLTSLVT